MFLEGGGPREPGLTGASPPLEVRYFSAVRLEIARPCDSFFQGRDSSVFPP